MNFPWSVERVNYTLRHCCDQKTETVIEVDKALHESFKHLNAVQTSHCA